MYKICKVNDYLTGVMTRGNFEDTIRSVVKDYSEFIIIHIIKEQWCSSRMNKQYLFPSDALSI